MTEISDKLWASEFGDRPKPPGCTLAQFHALCRATHAPKATDIDVQFIEFAQELRKKLTGDFRMACDKLIFDALERIRKRDQL